MPTEGLKAPSARSSATRSPLASTTAATTDLSMAPPCATAASTAAWAASARMVCCERAIFMAGLSSGNDAQESFVELALVVEDSLADLGLVPGAGRQVGVISVAAGEHLVAIAGRVEEVDRLAAGDAVAGRADIDRNIVAGDDIGRVAHRLPVFQIEGNMVQLAGLRMFDEGDVMRLHAASQPDRQQAVWHVDTLGQAEVEDLGEEVEHLLD